MLLSIAKCTTRRPTSEPTKSNHVFWKLPDVLNVLNVFFITELTKSRAIKVAFTSPDVVKVNKSSLTVRRSGRVC